jgi:hypothetical protein
VLLLIELLLLRGVIAVFARLPFSEMKGLFHVSEQAKRIAGQRFAFFSGGNLDSAKVPVAIFAERFHIEAVVIA